MWIWLISLCSHPLAQSNRATWPHSFTPWKVIPTLMTMRFLDQDDLTGQVRFSDPCVIWNPIGCSDTSLVLRAFTQEASLLLFLLPNLSGTSWWSRGCGNKLLHESSFPIGYYLLPCSHSHCLMANSYMEKNLTAKAGAHKLQYKCERFLNG